METCFSKRLYCEPNLIEWFFSKLKQFRRVATRYDKLAANFIAMVQLASIRLWLRNYGSTAEYGPLRAGARSTDSCIRGMVIAFVLG